MEESINISRPTAIRICRFLRKLCILDLDKNKFVMGGPNETVEIDGSVFNKVKFNRGKDLVHYSKEKQLWVFGLKARSTGKCFFQAVCNLKEKTLLPIIQKHVLPKTSIYSDQFKKLRENFVHFTVNHSKQFIDKRTGCNTNGIEGLWNKCKSKIRASNGVNRKYLQEYLDEIMWRHNVCLVTHKNDKKQKKSTRRNAFKRILILLHINNIHKLNLKLQEIIEMDNLEKVKEKQRHRDHFLSDEFVISRNRIKNIKRLLSEVEDDDNAKDEDTRELEGKPIPLVSRLTQTNASVFDYDHRRKKFKLVVEEPRVYVKSFDMIDRVFFKFGDHGVFNGNCNTIPYCLNVDL
ncbi:ISXO2-like domain-containing [Brachionus plicatilis]|uniref:ISXO2-like domain-containing n=1 Tax=Brachionus plicatilis TaxID=10195 RepID=A0A3M7S5Z9_BRAPC|nr:ISXO2-like domain-containing [Brachionus plicatilis]